MTPSTFQSLVASADRWRAAARPADWPLTVVDWGICSVLFVAPLFYGGRNDLGLFIYSAIVALIAAAWLAHVAVHGSAAGDRAGGFCPTTRFLLVAAPALLLLQLAPLPTWLLHAVSPGISDHLIAWSGGGRSFGAWRSLSVDPWSTRASLATLLSHGVLLTVAAQRLASVADVRWLVTRVGAASAVMAALAIVQYASGAKDLLWCCPLAFRDASRAAIGSFTTPNHCGHFLALGAGAMLIETIRQGRRLREALAKRRATIRAAADAKTALMRFSVVLAATLAICAGVLLTFSRGAFLSLGVGLGVTTLLLARAGWIGRAHLLRASVLVVVFGIGLSVTGYDELSHQSGGVTVDDLEYLADATDRMSVWRANAAAFASNPVLGYGAGSHEQVYQLFLDKPAAVTFTHAESGYLQIATEAGAAGVALLLAAIALVGGWCVRGVLCSSHEDELVLWAAIAAALAVSLFHSIADFVWFIPSCVAPVALLAAAAMRLHRLRVAPAPRPQRAAPVLRGLTGLAAACLCVALLWAPCRSAIPRDHYDQHSAALKRFGGSLFAKRRVGDPMADEQLLTSREYFADKMIEELRAAALVDPANPKTQLRLATQCLQRFELAQASTGGGIGVDAIRATVQDSGFPSRRAVADWLRRAFGESSGLLLTAYEAADRAARLCPLQGEAYLILADLSFLSDADAPDGDLLVEQALRVRPLKGSVLFQAGKHYFLAGRQEPGLALWTRAGRIPGGHLAKLASVVSSLMPAHEFVSIFDPDWNLTYSAYEFYRSRGAEADLRALADHAVVAARANEQTELPRRSAHNWWQAAAIYQELGANEQAVACAAEAYRLDPNRLHIRRALAAALYQHERYDEADPHIRWCLARRPDDVALRRWLEAIAKHRLDHPSPIAAWRVVDRAAPDKEPAFTTVTGRDWNTRRTGAAQTK